MAEILSINNLVKKFKKNDGSFHTAVNGISFSLQEGEIFSFLGPNGAGKSTTINMITSLLKPTSGSIRLDGVDISDNPTRAKLNIGVVAQHNNLDRSLTAYENLIFHGRYFGMEETTIKERANHLLKDFGLEDWRNDYVRSFSGGMVQRLKIARAIMHYPKLLLLDEPTTGLDPAYREILWEQVLKLNKENNTTVFLTTHYMEEPEELSDRVAIYREGQILAIGTVDEIRALVPAESVVYLTLKTINSEIINTLNNLDSVDHIVQSDNFNLTIYPSNSDTVLSEIIHTIQKLDTQLDNIQLSTTSLEDAYIHLTESKGDTIHG